MQASNGAASRGVKREHSDDDDEEVPTRRVNRYKNTAGLPMPSCSMKNIVLTLQTNNEGLLLEDLDELYDKIIDNDQAQQAKNQKDFLQLGGHMVLVKEMNVHYDSSDVQTAIMAVLIAATCKNQEVQTALAMVDGAKAAVNAMKEFSSEEKELIFGEEDVMDNACKLLGNMSSHEPLRKTLVKAKAISALGTLIEGDYISNSTKAMARKILKELLDI